MCPKNKTREGKKGRGGIIQEGVLVNLKTKNLLKYKNLIKGLEDKVKDNVPQDTGNRRLTSDYQTFRIKEQRK